MVFCFVQIFFSDNTRVRIFFFCRARREFFSHNLTLGYMTKTLNQIIFFLHHNQNIFFSNNGNQNIFLEKNHNPPFKLNGRSLRIGNLKKIILSSINIFWEWIKDQLIWLSLRNWVNFLHIFRLYVQSLCIGTECSPIPPVYWGLLMKSIKN
jgi:hypothetical protein